MAYARVHMIVRNKYICVVIFFLFSHALLSYDYDLVVIGGGLSGLQAARTALEYDKKIAIVEKSSFAENKLLSNFAVKTLSRIGSIGYQVQTAYKFSVCNEIEGLLNHKTVLPYVRSVIKKIHEQTLHTMLDDQRVTVIHGTASFINRHTIKVGTQEISAEKYIIATGGVQKKLPMLDGIESVNHFNVETFFAQDVIPQSIIILGSNALAVEIACALASMGVQVTMLIKYGLFLPGYDYEMVDQLSSFMESIGVVIQKNTIAQSVRSRNGQVSLTCRDISGSELVFEAEALFLSQGCKPNIQSLNLDAIGVKYSASGVHVDSTLKTTIDTIYACGNVTSSSDKLTRIAEYQATIAGNNVFCSYWGKRMYADYIHASRIVFSTIPLASTGMTEQDAIKKYGNNLIICRVPYAQIDRAHVDNTIFGLGKFICNKDGVLVGAHILGECAGELIDSITIGKKLSDQYSEYLFKLHTPPSYFDLIWLAAEHSRKSVSIGESLWSSLLQKCKSYYW